MKKYGRIMIHLQVDFFFITITCLLDSSFIFIRRSYISVTLGSRSINDNFFFLTGAVTFHLQFVIQVHFQAK